MAGDSVLSSLQCFDDRTDGKFVKLFCIPNLSLSEQVEKEPTNHTHTRTRTHTRTHTHAHAHARTRARALNGPLSGTTRVSRYQKGKTNLDFAEARDSEWQWHQLGNMQVCTSLQTDNHASTPPLSFLQAGCPSCRPTNSVKVLKAVFSSEQVEKEPTNQLIQIHLKNSR